MSVLRMVVVDAGSAASLTCIWSSKGDMTAVGVAQDWSYDESLRHWTRVADLPSWSCRQAWSIHTRYTTPLGAKRRLPVC